ncbi:hypothetical protein J2795_001400 [Chryseobacterium bernardetii]|jgi:hypothetical protein|uniref:Uncharacterized protein n=3 Tax=Chryseobacterium TaxID=59732 RepID=A0A543EJ85_9FLAO|nr:hypothetical protein [Chryseobacterium vietnamense]MDR6440700.1 hypothetical protein [Chryseobacterium bernardetii]MDR6458088.1 hypothetical protein [Chryseobacterium vietnamense]MDR6486793.1 hypothetical protein [Chryseobacterium vietnamense]TQM21619.1 hypothetical protein FB551_1309 [Chryseobacterium aquifrigidense]
MKVKLKKVPQKFRFHKTVINLAHPLLFFVYIIHTTIKIIGFDTYFSLEQSGEFLLLLKTISNY